MVSPSILKRGDKVGIVATGRKLSAEQLAPAIEILEGWGVEVICSSALLQNGHSYLAGTDSTRLSSLQQFLNDPEISAIICARGGYGTTRIIDQVDFTSFLAKPKWVVGFSDVTALHLKLTAIGVESIHGTMPVLFYQEDSASSVESLRRVLFGSSVELRTDPCPENRNGKATGELIGGNLSLLTDSLGTSDQLDAAGKILIIEEVDEYLYKIDRMIVQLKRAGILDHLAGLVVGHFTAIKDTELSFGESFRDIFLFHTRDYAYPVAFGFPVGHENPNYSWITGRTAVLEVSDNGVALTQPSLSNKV